MTNWFIASEEGSQQGPLSDEEMRSKIDLGEVSPDSLVWHDGMTDWARADATELAGFFVKQPPPLPHGFAARTSDMPIIQRQPAAGRADPPYDQPPPRSGPGPAGMGYAAPPMGPLEAVKSCLSKYFTFSGRASRSEFWYWALFTFLANIVAGFIDGGSNPYGGPGVLGGLLSLAIFVPSLAVASRRLHDTGRSGWWQLIWLIPLFGGIILFVWFCFRGRMERTIYDD